MGFFLKYKYLPATILAEDPFIFACFFEDFVRRIEGFKIWFKDNAKYHKNICAVFMFGYHYETYARMEIAKGQIEQIRKFAPNLKMVFLCNSEIERENFENIKERAVYCSQNAFLRECRYRVTKQKRIYDALYLARITPIKRHALALKVPRLLLIGDYFQSEKEYAEGILANLRPDTVWIRKVRGLLMYRKMNQARVGLCLSPEEGAMYSAAEYGLCGLPVLTTKCLGGRENSLSEKYVKFIDSDNPTQEDVAKGVEELIAENFDPNKIRSATIAVLKEHRARYEKMLRDLFKECGSNNEKELQKAIKFPHKFGVRCRVLPLFKYLHAMKIHE